MEAQNYENRFAVMVATTRPWSCLSNWCDDSKRSGPATLLVELAGQPKVGKSTVFNMLTRLSQHVGNWPGKTVERREGSCVHDGFALRLIDLRRFTPHRNSREERIARDFILQKLRT